MSYSLTVREKEHWKDRIAARIDKRIDALRAEHHDLLQRVQQSALKRALDSLGIATLQARADRLDLQIATLQRRQDRAYRDIIAKLRGMPRGDVSCGRYEISSEIKAAVAKRQTTHEDEILAESAPGREILALRREKENLLDTVWLATSGKQIKDLWERVELLLGSSQTDLQRMAMEIAPVEEN